MQPSNKPTNTTTRITASVNSIQYELIENAARIKGMSPNQLVLEASLSYAEGIINTYSNMHLSPSEAETLISCLNEPPTPTSITSLIQYRTNGR